MISRSILARGAALTILYAGVLFATGQTPPAADTNNPHIQSVTRADLPPSSIYTETLAPAEAVHADITNWSDIEIAAYTAAMVTAKAECKRLEQTPHEGEEALALARLCSLGQDWDGTYSAARWYTRATAPVAEVPHLPLGFGLMLQADLSVPIVRRALNDLTEMNHRLPLTADTDSVFNYAIHALEVTQPEAGLTAALLRQPALLSIAGGVVRSEPAIAIGTAEAECWHTLALLHAARRDADEQAQREALLAAISGRATPLPVAEAYLAQRARKQYEWLGKSMPDFRTVRNTYPAAKGGGKPLSAGVKLLVIEREDASDVPALTGGMDALRSRLQPQMQATLVLTAAPTAAAQPQTKLPPVHAVYTNDPLLEQFAASSGPLFLVIDAEGKLAYLSAGTTAWLNPQMQAEILLERTLNKSSTASQSWHNRTTSLKSGVADLC